MNEAPQEAQHVLAALASGEWSLTRPRVHGEPGSWRVERMAAPLCDSDGNRHWCGASAAEALQRARAALGLGVEPVRLTGMSAVVMHAAKSNLQAQDDLIEHLRRSIAVAAGFANPAVVSLGDMLYLVSRTHDFLVEQGLITRSAQQLVENTRYLPSDMPPSKILLTGMLNVLRLMRVRTQANEVLLEWQSGLPKRFGEEDAPAPATTG